MKPPCAKCGHSESDHEPRLYGIECRGELPGDDMPHWVGGKGQRCQCEGYEPAKGKAA